MFIRWKYGTNFDCDKHGSRSVGTYIKHGRDDVGLILLGINAMNSAPQHSKLRLYPVGMGCDNSKTSELSQYSSV